MRTWFHVNRLIDGSGDPPVNDVLVGVEGTKIVEVATLDTGAVADTDLVWEFSESSMLPGFVDVHAHLSLAADGRTYEQMVGDSDELMALVGARNALLHLKAGVTTIRDNGARNRVAFVIREAIERGYVLGPRVLASGRPVTPTGGHFSWCNGVADGADAIRVAIRQLIGEGADHIKIMASGGGTASTNPGFPSYTVEEMRLAVEVAHDFHRLTTAHCRATEGMARAVEAGIDCMEHAEFLTPDGQIEFDQRVAEALADSSMFISPTLQAWGHWRLVGLGQVAQDRELTREEGTAKQQLEDHLRSHLESFHSLLDLGLRSRMVFGTDAGPLVTEFGQVSYGLHLMVRGGLTPMEAILAATSVAAKACGQHEIGRVAPGFEADLVIVRGNPLDDIQCTSDVQVVVKSGAVVHSSGLFAPTLGGYAIRAH